MKLTIVSAALVASLFSVSANATPNFPPGIQNYLDLKAAPDCALCHTDGDQGGLGTVNTPFGKDIRARGVVPFDVGSLQKALDQMESDKVNSAGACLDDIDELKAGGDPNEAAAPGSCTAGANSQTESANGSAPSSPQSGGCSITHSAANSSFFAGFAIGAALLLARRRRRNAA